LICKQFFFSGRAQAHGAGVLHAVIGGQKTKPLPHSNALSRAQVIDLQWEVSAQPDAGTANAL
jgi:hypothetical protein